MKEKEQDIKGEIFDYPGTDFTFRYPLSPSEGAMTQEMKKGEMYQISISGEKKSLIIVSVEKGWRYRLSKYVTENSNGVLYEKFKDGETDRIRFYGTNEVVDITFKISATEEFLNSILDSFKFTIEAKETEHFIPKNPIPLQFDSLQSKLGAPAISKLGLVITPLEILEDSLYENNEAARNNTETGTVVIKAKISEGNQEKNITLRLGEMVRTDFGNITLNSSYTISAIGRPFNDTFPDLMTYTFVFGIQR